MTFFEHQGIARRNTRLMVALYLVAVIGVVAAVDLVLAIGWLWTHADVRMPMGSGLSDLFGAVPGRVLAWGAAGTLGVIAAASIFNIIQLMDGGAAVAKMAGARPVSLSTRDPLERRLLNVVEEMAIASGVRVPTSWVMDDESGINAFAAGYNVNNAVVTVTRGTLETLDREELQGVIGHEFSHILNGDMWLNIRMMGVLAGIVFIGSVGMFIMRSAGSSRLSRSRDGRGAAGVFAAGLALWVIGSVGIMAARLIKAAVSRQREFLADASSVQFTRNPDGIAGALDQIRVSDRGGLLANRYAEEMSHMYFAKGVTVWLEGLFDTHPPIDERIERVNPAFMPGSYRAQRARAMAADAAAHAAATPDVAESVSYTHPPDTDDASTYDGALAPLAGTAGAAGFAAASGATFAAASSANLSYEGQRREDTAHAWGRRAGQNTQSTGAQAADVRLPGAHAVGTLDAGKVDYAARMLAQLPDGLRAAMREPQGASAVLVATLLAPKDEVMQVQLDALRTLFMEPLAEQARSLAPVLGRFGHGYDLLIIDLCLPALKAATDEDRRRLLAALEAVIRADRRVSLHEFIVLTLVRHQLAPVKATEKNLQLPAVKDELALIMSLVAHAGVAPVHAGADSPEARAVTDAFSAGAKVTGLAGLQLVSRDKLSLQAAGQALARLTAVAPLTKAIVVKALFAVVTADGTIRLAEAELMRLIGAVLDCPLPPLLEHIDPATLVD